MGYYQKLLAGLFLLITGNIALAIDQPITNRFSGFATIGIVTNDNTNLAFHRDVTQNDGPYDEKIEWRNDSILGLQWQTQWSYQFETTAQFVLKERLDNSLKNSLEWGFLRYRPVDDIDVRVGRMGSDIFMLSDYRQVGYALLWVRPPHDTYGLLAIDHFDGIDILKRINLSDSTLNIKAFYGTLNQKYPIARGENLSYHLDFEGGGGSISWERNEWKLRYSYAIAEISNNNPNPLIEALDATAVIWPEASDLAEKFYTKSKRIEYQQIGFVYDNNTWVAQAEISRLNSETDTIFGTHHFYLSLGRRIDAFTLYATSGYVHSVKSPLQVSIPAGYPPPLQQQIQILATTTESVINGARSNQRSMGVGVRWDFTSKMALKFQADTFEVDKYGSALWLKADATTASKDETAHVLSLSLDMLF